MDIPPQNTSLVVMGVAGCGKSSLGNLCAESLDMPLLEGDDFHSESNVAKMRSGIALSDDDRAVWLNTLAEQLQAHPQGVVLTCSALKGRDRARWASGVPAARSGSSDTTPAHLFPVSLVASQFAALEDPCDEPGVLRLDATQPLNDLGLAVVDWVRPAPLPVILEK